VRGWERKMCGKSFGLTGRKMRDEGFGEGKCEESLGRVCDQIQQFM